MARTCQTGGNRPDKGLKQSEMERCAGMASNQSGKCGRAMRRTDQQGAKAGGLCVKPAGEALVVGCQIRSTAALRSAVSPPQAEAPTMCPRKRCVLGCGLVAVWGSVLRQEACSLADWLS